MSGNSGARDGPGDGRLRGSAAPSNPSVENGVHVQRRDVRGRFVLLTLLQRSLQRRRRFRIVSIADDRTRWMTAHDGLSALLAYPSLSGVRVA